MIGKRFIFIVGCLGENLRGSDGSLMIGCRERRENV